MLCVLSFLLLLSIWIEIPAALRMPRDAPAPNGPAVIDQSRNVTYLGNLSAGIESFFNVRFAQDTSGANRFAQPKAFSYPNGFVVNGATFGASCPQLNMTSLISPPVQAISEDCLTLRIDRLQNTTVLSNLPVMVYIFGGGFSSGTIYASAYDPTGLLKAAAANGSPVIYAAVNYRLNLFGFASSEALTQEDNLNVGLYDQRMGLQWIQNNIHLFGGDPNQITIFGESAGANSIGNHILAFGGSKPAPFSRAVMQSGEGDSPAGTAGNSSTIRTTDVANMMNCSATNSSAQLECLRAAPLSTLLPIVIQVELEISSTALLAWRPIAPSTWLPDSPSKLLYAGNFTRNVDMLLGWNENDGSLFAEPDITTDGQVISTIIPPASFDNATAEQALAMYPLSEFSPIQDGNKTATAQYFRASQMWRDTFFVCPALLLSQAMTNYSTSYTTSYLYVLNTTTEGAALAKENETYLGVVHGSDVPFVFDTVEAMQTTSTPAQRQLSNQMAASWSAFATTGNVSYGANPVMGWFPTMTRSNTSTFEVMILGGPFNGTTPIDAGALASEKILQRCAFWNSPDVLAQMQK